MRNGPITKSRVDRFHPRSSGGIIRSSQALDFGADGVLVPGIRTFEEARVALASTRYSPQGGRGLAFSSRARSPWISRRPLTISRPWCVFRVSMEGERFWDHDRVRWAVL